MERIEVDLEVQEYDEKKYCIPIWKKFLLKPKEAAAYTNIGENTIRKLTKEPNCNFILYDGNRILIKRKEFEKYLTNIQHL